jgi:choline dehydrogenase-like flavoprotein
MAEKYDAIVVGSGISGGWAAKELTEKGLKTLLLERGKDVKHVTDYDTATKNTWEFPHRGRITNEMKATHPVQKRDYPYSEFKPDWWVNDLDCPYTEVKRFDWYRGFHVGGKSLMWGRQSYRWSDFDFEANAKDGIAVDWPIRYKDIAPWYDYVEQFAGISGSMEGLPQLPDGKFLPPMDLNIVEKDVAARIKKQYGGKRAMIIGRSANLTQPHNGRGSCQFRDRCSRGCPYGAYFSTQSSTLPAAVATGNLTLRPFSIVTQILYDKDKKRAKGVLVIDAETNQTIEYEAKVIFVCGSTLGSTFLLLNSADQSGGIGNSSGQLGRNLMDHHFRCGANGEVEGYEDKYYFGDFSFIKDKNYTLITNINEIKTNTDSFSYICFCGQERTRTLFNIKNCKGELNNPKYIPDCCIENGFALSIDSSKWHLDKSINEYKDSNEVKWKRFQQYWISEKGIIIGSKGIPLETHNNEFKFSRKVM